MLKIDNNLLNDLDLSALPDTEKNSLLKHIYETLEMRVGMRLADQMTNQQLDEFEQYFEAKDDAGAFKWLESNFPNYKDIVQEEFDKLKAEIQQSAGDILAASQAQMAAGPAPMQSQQSQQPQQVQAAAPVAAQPLPSQAQPQPPMPQPQYAQPPQPVPQPMPPQQPVYQQSAPMPQPQPQFPQQQPPAGPARF
jgi:hypothetical protein